MSYVLTHNAPETKDIDFNCKDFQTRNNSELVSIFCNFVNRALVLIKKYVDGKVPPCGELTDYDRETLKEFADVKKQVEHYLDQFKFREAQKEAMNLARIGNKYLADSEPWKLAKTDMARTGTILHIALQIAANLAIAFEPFLPFSAERLRKMLQMPHVEWERLGAIDLLQAGTTLGEVELLFDKIEDAAIEAQIEKLLATKRANELDNYSPNGVKENVAFDDFAKMDIRVGTVLACSKVPKADKLLEFKLDDGMGGRTILSGIAQSYPNPEELVGKQVLFIANFEPRKLRGSMSEGMILSAENADGKLVLVEPSKTVVNGVSVG